MNSGGGPVTQTYDAAGNLTNDGSQSFVYDGASRLKQASGGTSSYGYDGDGRRVRVTDNGTAVAYVYSSVLGQSVLEANSTGVQRAYVYAGNKLVAQQSTDGQFYWLHTNHLNSARAMTDTSGTLVYKGQFDPYGQALSEWSATGNTNLNTKKFTGYERDAATGLDYANARMYNSARGRFMQPDPIGLKAAKARRPGSLNRYSYVMGDPVNYLDTAGTDIQCWGSFLIEDGIITAFFGISFCTAEPELDNTGPIVTVIQDPERQRQLDAINEGFNDALNALRISGQCAAFFGGLDLAEFVMSSVANIIRPLPLPDNPTAGIGLIEPWGQTMSSPNGGNFIYRIPALIGVNTANPLGGYFGGGGQFGPYSADSRRGRALAWLHELAHMIGSRGPNGEENWLIPTDGRAPGQSETNTATILSHCQSEIENQIPE